MANILILEDDYALAKRWQEALVAAGHKVTTSYTSSEALLHNRNDKFDVYVVDLKIDIALETFTDSGVRFLGQLHKLHSKFDISRRVIGVSGLLVNDDDRQSRHAFEMFDVKVFLPKPFSPSTLIAAVEERLAVLGSQTMPPAQNGTTDPADLE